MNFNTGIFSYPYLPSKTNFSNSDNPLDFKSKTYSSQKIPFDLDSTEDNFVKILEQKNKALEPMDFLDENINNINNSIYQELLDISSAFNSSAPISKSDSIILP